VVSFCKKFFNDYAKFIAAIAGDCRKSSKASFTLFLKKEFAMAKLFVIFMQCK
jgi:hypothetical protein